MGEDTRQIAQVIRAERHDLGRNLDELQQQAKALTDWRTHYRRHPGTSLGLAFGSGMILGLLASGSRARGGRNRGWSSSLAGFTRTSAESATPDSPSRPSRLAALKHLADNPRARRQVGDAWDHMLEALLGVASAKAIDLISNVIPGFREEYRSRTGEAEPRHDVPRRAGMAPTS